jgi:hypothetical protein
VSPKSPGKCPGISPDDVRDRCHVYIHSQEDIRMSFLKKLFPWANGASEKDWTTCKKCGGKVRKTTASASSGLCSVCARADGAAAFPTEKSYMALFLFDLRDLHMSAVKDTEYSETSVLDAAKTALSAPSDSKLSRKQLPLFIASSYLDLHTSYKPTRQNWERMLTRGGPPLDKVLDITVASLKNLGTASAKIVCLLPLERPLLEAVHNHLTSKCRPYYIGALILKTTLNASPGMAGSLGIEALLRKVPQEKLGAGKQLDTDKRDRGPAGTLEFSITCLVCGRELEPAKSSGAAMEGGSRCCTECSEEHLYTISEGKLVLRRVSHPVGSKGAAEVTVLPMKKG